MKTGSGRLLFFVALFSSIDLVQFEMLYRMKRRLNFRLFDGRGRFEFPAK